MKPKAHVFLRDSQLFVTTETISEKPGIDPRCKKPNCMCHAFWDEYDAALASIRDRAVLADWSKLDVYTLDKYAHGESGGPEFWVHKGDDKRKRVIEGEFYPLDCEVRYTCNADCNINYGQCCHSPCIKVAILSSIGTCSSL